MLWYWYIFLTLNSINQMFDLLIFYVHDSEFNTSIYRIITDLSNGEIRRKSFSQKLHN